MMRFRRNADDDLHPPLDAFSEADWERMAAIRNVVRATAIPAGGLVFETFTAGMVMSPVLPRVPGDFDPRHDPTLAMLWSVLPEALAYQQPGAEEVFEALPRDSRPARLVYGTYHGAERVARKVAEEAAAAIAEARLVVPKGKYFTDQLLGWEYGAYQTRAGLWAAQPTNDDVLPNLGFLSPDQWDIVRDFQIARGRPFPTEMPPYLFNGDYYARTAPFAPTLLAVPVWPRAPYTDESQFAEDTVWLVFPRELQESDAEKLMQRVHQANLPRPYDVPASPAYFMRGTFDDVAAFIQEWRRSWIGWLRPLLNDENSKIDTDLVTSYQGPWCRVDVRTDAIAFLYWLVDSNVFGSAYLQEADAMAAAQEAARRCGDEGGSSDDVVYNTPLQRARRLYSDETIAIVLKPPTRTIASPGRLMAVHLIAGGNLGISFAGKYYGTGYLDYMSIGECARTHTPDGVRAEGMGYGAALYAALATRAWQEYELECIGSAPAGRGFGGRSEDADRWWGNAVSRGIAAATDVCDGCAAANLGTFIQRGLVLWMRYPDGFESDLTAALEKYLAAFLSAEPDPDELELIDATLSAVASPETMDAWRDAHHGMAANPRRRSRKPAFVTPQLEAHVAALYADLEGL